ncbi:MAG: hypothetical protein ACI8TX_000466 [Hyphomicrobiaceae bacterium]|jgi:uncharacterized protein YaiI (UPF0178 family)
MLTIFVDADACPVKDEVYRVATRCELQVRVVANSFINVPRDGRVELITVGSGDDVADDWIAERAGPGDIVVTADILLASRCLKAGARVIGTKGLEFTEDSIGGALAGRELSQQLREMGMETRGPAPMEKKDRGRFLNTLDTVIQAIRRANG